MVNYKKHLDIELFEGEISNHQYPWHYHESYTLISIEKGSILYEFKDRSIQLEENEILIIEPYMVHRNIISKSTNYKAFFIPHEYYIRNNCEIIKTQKISGSNSVYHIRNILNVIKNADNIGEIKMQIIELFETYCEQETDNIGDIKDKINFTHVINHDLSIDELAAEANMSKFHFQRKFKKESGLTVGQIKQQDKTTRAKYLLENGKQSTDIAYELGFFDQSHFIKYFKKMWAITPRNFK